MPARARQSTTAPPPRSGRESRQGQVSVMPAAGLRTVPWRATPDQLAGGWTPLPTHRLPYVHVGTSAGRLCSALLASCYLELALK